MKLTATLDAPLCKSNDLNGGTGHSVEMDLPGVGETIFAFMTLLRALAQMCLQRQRRPSNAYFSWFGTSPSTFGTSASVFGTLSPVSSVQKALAETKSSSGSPEVPILGCIGSWHLPFH